ncbi:MAG: helix-turn-helix domain-containing protein [Coriobacteriia bacterium]|nr:helix-turn-helix domain-containing protein [Coriobacteriia bacterium]
MTGRKAADPTGPAPGAPPPGMIAALEPGRRGEILDAALQVFAEKGYAGGSMRDIATVVGVSEPALYRHFPGKEALFLALVRVAAGHLRGEAFELLDAIRPETLRAQIAAALIDRRRRVALFGPVLRTLFSAATHDPVMLAELRVLVIEPALERLAAKVEELDAAYGVDSDEESRRARVRAFFALFVGSLATSVALGDQPDEAIADAVVRMMGWEGRA